MEKLREKEFYREKIIEMVRKIGDTAALASIYSFIMGILSAKGKREAD